MLNAGVTINDDCKTIWSEILNRKTETRGALFKFSKDMKSIIPKGTFSPKDKSSSAWKEFSKLFSTEVRAATFRFTRES